MFTKFLLLLTFLFTLQAHAEITVSATVAEAKLAAEQKCEKACIVLSPEDIAELEAKIQEALEQAYQAGLKGWASAS